MTVAVADMVSDVRRFLADFPYETTITADPGTATAGETDTIAVADGTDWVQGSRGEFVDTGERFYVLSISTNTLTAIRGYENTTTSAHTAATPTNRILKDPVWGYVEIKDAIQGVVTSLWPYVYKKVTLTNITPLPSGTGWYDLTATTMAPIMAVQLLTGSGKPFFYGTRGGSYPISIERNLPAALVASGVGAYIPFLRDTTAAISLTVAQKITATISSSSYSDIDDGMMREMVAYGAVERLLSMREPGRVAGEDINQYDQSVRPQDRLSSAAYFRGRYKELREQMKMELETTYPIMRKNSRGAWEAR